MKRTEIFTHTELTTEQALSKTWHSALELTTKPKLFSHKKMKIKEKTYRRDVKIILMFSYYTCTLLENRSVCGQFSSIIGNFRNKRNALPMNRGLE